MARCIGGACRSAGKVVTSTPERSYGGPALTANVTYYWSVTVWDLSGLQSPYSSDATFAILDIGLQDGTETIWIAADFVGVSYPLRIHRNGTTYGIVLVDPADPSASSIRIRRSTGVKALKKM